SAVQLGTAGDPAGVRPRHRFVRRPRRARDGGRSRRRSDAAARLARARAAARGPGMTAADQTQSPLETGPRLRGLRRFVHHHPSLVTMPALLALFLGVTVAIHPGYDSFDAQSLAMGAMPLAFAAAAQAVVLISGGIDLSVGSMIAVCNVLAAATMENATFGQS